MKPQLLVTFPLLLLATSSAFAADSVSGPYLGAGLGVAQSADTDNHGDLDPDGLGYNLYGGYYFNRIVGILQEITLGGRFLLGPEVEDIGHLCTGQNGVRAGALRPRPQASA